MPLNPIQAAPGKLLVAEPGIAETYFIRSVVYLTEHNEDGSVGFLLNKPLDLKVSDVVKELRGISLPLFLGGPVGRDSLFYIHTLGNKIEDSRLIDQGVFWGGDFEQIIKAVQTGAGNEKNLRFFVGYSGWDSGQLDAELNRNSWVVAPTNKEEVMNLETTNLWKDVLRGMGKDLALLSFFPENPSLN